MTRPDGVTPPLGRIPWHRSLLVRLLLTSVAIAVLSVVPSPPSMMPIPLSLSLSPGEMPLSSLLAFTIF